MNLLIVRHARAEDRATFALTRRPDSQRPLTRKGIRRMKKAARGLRLVVPAIDLLASSPFRRAVQTAQIVADAYDAIALIQRDELAPGAGTKPLIRWLAAQARHATACVVGHEPDLSELVAALLCDPSKRPTNLKKGSVCLLQFAGPIEASGATLAWYRSAKDLASRD